MKLLLILRKLSDHKILGKILLRAKTLKKERGWGMVPPMEKHCPSDFPIFSIDFKEIYVIFPCKSALIFKPPSKRLQKKTGCDEIESCSVILQSKFIFYFKEKC